LSWTKAEQRIDGHGCGCPQVIDLHILRDKRPDLQRTWGSGIKERHCIDHPHQANAKSHCHERLQWNSQLPKFHDACDPFLRVNHFGMPRNFGSLSVNAAYPKSCRAKLSHNSTKIV
jgi:hypothetical protein